MDLDGMMEEVSAGSNNNSTFVDHQTMMILKGKRTKRQRPLSPVGRVTSSCSSGGGVGGGGGDHHYNSFVSATDQEEEDMAANCLILLAQGHHLGGGVKQGEVVKEEEEEEVKLVNNTATAAVAATATVKSDFYVYECKTCNRTFPSFQALGGHRASHKKPKSMAEEKRVVVASSIYSDQQQQGGGREAEAIEIEESSWSEEEEEVKKGIRQTMINTMAPAAAAPIANPIDQYSSQISTMDHQILFSNKLIISSQGNKISSSNKIHECSICGSEFSSGQALGGHMRRHRNPSTTNTTKSTVDHHHHHHHPTKKNTTTNTIFPLDLNLPAPPEDHDHRDLKFQYAANQKQHLVFSAPALVDCHY